MGVFRHSNMIIGMEALQEYLKTKAVTMEYGQGSGISGTQVYTGGSYLTGVSIYQVYMNKVPLVLGKFFFSLIKYHLFFSIMKHIKLAGSLENHILFQQCIIVNFQCLKKPFYSF